MERPEAGVEEWDRGRLGNFSWRIEVTFEPATEEPAMRQQRQQTNVGAAAEHRFLRID